MGFNEQSRASVARTRKFKKVHNKSRKVASLKSFERKLDCVLELRRLVSGRGRHGGEFKLSKGNTSNIYESSMRLLDKVGAGFAVICTEDGLEVFRIERPA